MKTKDIAFIAAGLILFVAISVLGLLIPTVKESRLCLGYIIMMEFVWCYKWYEGAIIGFLGIFLYGIVEGLGFAGIPGWSVGVVAIDLIIGLSLKYIQSVKNKLLQILLASITAIIGTFVGIGLVSAFVESLIRKKAFIDCFYSTRIPSFNNALIIVICIPICILTEKWVKRIRYGK